jgi:hypothetical protein
MGDQCSRGHVAHPRPNNSAAVVLMTGSSPSKFLHLLLVHEEKFLHIRKTNN